MASSAESVTVTVRLIRSFEYRNIKPVLFRSVNLDQTASQFMKYVNDEIEVRPGLPPPFRSYSFDPWNTQCYFKSCLELLSTDTMKIQHKAHGAKTSDPVINSENDNQLILKEHVSLRDNGVAHETELSYFKEADYTNYKANPTVRW